MHKLLMMLLVSALLIPLAGCKTTGTAVTEVCRAPEGQQPVWRPITWSKRDTPETIDEVKSNNARHEAWCKR